MSFANCEVDSMDRYCYIRVRYLVLLPAFSAYFSVYALFAYEIILYTDRINITPCGICLTICSIGEFANSTMRVITLVFSLSLILVAYLRAKEISRLINVVYEKNPRMCLLRLVLGIYAITAFLSAVFINASIKYGTVEYNGLHSLIGLIISMCILISNGTYICLMQSIFHKNLSPIQISLKAQQKRIAIYQMILVTLAVVTNHDTLNQCHFYQSYTLFSISEHLMLYTFLWSLRIFAAEFSNWHFRIKPKCITLGHFIEAQD